MKKALHSFFFLIFSFGVFAQEMTVKKANFTSFRSDKYLITKTLEQNSSDEAKQHPEYGILPFNAQCSECVELIDKRTQHTRFFTQPNRAGHTFSQRSYFPLHYKKFENDIWRTIDFRLRPSQTEANVYEANNQPVPTKCDLNTKTTTLTESGFQFEFNKNLTIYFFDENNAYTAREAGNYSDYTIGEEGLHVKNMWSGIDIQQQFRAGEIETDYIINAPLQLPISNGYLVIEDHFTLPAGFTFEEAANGKHENGFYQGDYELKNAEGKLLIVYEKPVYVDAKAWGMHGFYKLLKNENDYTIQTLVPVEWLNKAGNTYPLKIDPIVRGVTKLGDFRLAGLSANMGFSTNPLSCDYHMATYTNPPSPVVVPGQSTLKNTYIDLEYQLTYDNMCGNPPLPAPFCTFSQATMEVICDSCNTTTNRLACNPANPPFTGTCTTDPNLVPGAGPVTMQPSYLTCFQPQCPDYIINFTLKNRDSICGDVCGYLCARGNMWQTTVEACTVEGDITQNRTQVCAGEPVVFTAHPTCGVPPYHFAWTTDGGNTYDTIYGTPDYTVYPEQSIFVRCIIFDACNKDTLSSMLSVTVIPSPPVDAGSDTSLCAGGTVQLGGNPTTSSGTNVVWSGENITVRNYLNATNIQNPVATVPQGTVDTFFYVVSASNGTCTRRDTVYVFSAALPVADAGADVTVCGGGIITLNGTTNAANILWSGENSTVISWLNNTTVAAPQAVIPQGTIDTFFYVMSVSTATCTATDTVNVFSNPAPLANAGADQHVCEGGVANIGGNPTTTSSGNIVWSAVNPSAQSWLSSTTAANPQVSIPQDTLGSFAFILTVTEPLCSRSDTVNVISHLNPVAQVDTNGSTTICTNRFVTISTVGNYSAYQWNNGSTSSAINANQAGQYFVIVTDAFGCKDTSNIITVTTIPAPSVQVFPDTIITFGDSVTLYTDINLSASADSFHWYPAVNIACNTCTNPVVLPQEAAQYYGVNVYANGCLATDSALIRVIFPNNFFIPNAFTPNGDGNNDDFYIMAQSGVKVLLFQVFNRWGEKVHEGNFPWDGNYKSKPAPAGVYIYVFKIGLFGEEQSLFRKGSISLIR